MSTVKMNTGAVFERQEKKYLMETWQYDGLMRALAGRMAPDEYGRHTICTLYYDTDDYAVIRHSIGKPGFKTKLRLRSYGVPGPNSTVYLELKKKLAGTTYKRRMPLPYAEAGDYMENGWPPVDRGQIFGEIDWVKNQLSLSGKAVICNDRVAYVDAHDPGLRLTVDANLRWRDYSLDLTRGDHGSPLLPASMRLMEIKTLGALPLWLAQTLSALEIYPVSFSKYGTAYQNHLAGKEAMRHVG